MFSKYYNVGTNRGSKRVWIEGQVLQNLGVSRGLKFNRQMSDNEMVLVFDGTGNHTVAGTVQRPIIDLNGNYLNDLFENASVFYATFNSEEKTITILAIEGENMLSARDLNKLLNKKQESKK